MYAIIRTGGKQYRIAAGDTLKVDKLEADIGSTVELNDILFIGGGKNFIGKSSLENAKVTAVITQQTRGDKILVFKKKRRKGYRKTQGHRQFLTEIFIESITTPEGDTEKAKAEPKVKKEA